MGDDHFRPFHFSSHNTAILLCLQLGSFVKTLPQTSFFGCEFWMQEAWYRRGLVKANDQVGKLKSDHAGRSPYPFTTCSAQLPGVPGICFEYEILWYIWSSQKN
jgi:hypothetical protein